MKKAHPEKSWNHGVEFMNLVRQPNNWTCNPCAFAMVLGMTLEEMLREVGHDGSRVVNPAHDFPRNLEGFNDFQMHYVAFKKGYGTITFLARPGVDSPEGPIDISGNYWSFDEFSEWMMGKQGVIGVQSKRFKNCSHAVAWDGEKILDPQEDEPQAPSNYIFQSFTWVFKP